MRRSPKQGRGPEMVTASEIAAFVYCPEAWRLEHGLGLEAGNREAMEAEGREVGGVHRHWAAGGCRGGRGVAPALGAVPMMARRGWRLARCWPCCSACAGAAWPGMRRVAAWGGGRRYRSTG